VTARHPNAVLEIAGDGPLRPHLERLALAVGAGDSTHFLGNLDRSHALVRAYQRASIVIQPSHHEGMSTVVLEAMAAAVPVIATSVGGHATLIDDGVNGYLVPPREPGVLGAAIAGVLASGTSNEVGRKGRASVLARHSWTALASRHIEWYLETMGHASRVRRDQGRRSPRSA
jgi:glycosyltransferase involved in cell wall biosynthesis